MELTSSHQRRVVAAAIGAASVLVAWFAREPSGLLVAIAAACICFGWKAGLGAVAVGSLLSSVILLSPAYGAENGSVRLVVFVAAAFGLWLVVKIFRTISFYDRVYPGAGPISPTFRASAGPRIRTGAFGSSIPQPSSTLASRLKKCARSWMPTTFPGGGDLSIPTMSRRAWRNGATAWRRASR